MIKLATSLLRNQSLMKTVTYGLMHLTVAVMVAYALTGSIAIALSIGLIEPFVQTIFYNIHERIWSRSGAPRIPHNHGISV